MPDAAQYGDASTCNTLANVATVNGGLNLPNLQSMGLGNIIPVDGVPPSPAPSASLGRMIEVSKGKDSTTGHWELAGFVLERPFDVFPNGFPEELLSKFVEAIGVEGYLGNHPSSGTAVIERYHAEHTRTGYPIIYTSADSVFQIAGNVDVVPLETLYRWCEIARNIVNRDHNISRVIARPYQSTTDGLCRLSVARRDYGLRPSRPTLLNWVVEQGGRVIAVGKIADLFVESGVTHSVHTDTNQEGIDQTIAAIDGELKLDEFAISGLQIGTPNCELIFTNLVDTDTQFGHRRDPIGYKNALESIDQHVPQLLNRIGREDLLIITSDHGNDPTAAGTDHTREYVPLLMFNPINQPQNLGTIATFAFVSKTVRRWLEHGTTG